VHQVAAGVVKVLVAAVVAVETMALEVREGPGLPQALLAAQPITLEGVVEKVLPLMAAAELVVVDPRGMRVEQTQAVAVERGLPTLMEPGLRGVVAL